MDVSKQKTHIAIVLDSSGSMATVKQAALDGFNEYQESIMAKADTAGQVFVTLTVFGEHSDVVTKYQNEPADRLKPLTSSMYKPSGLTPMYDAIGQTISMLLDVADTDPDTAFLVFIITDGLENNSKWYGGRTLGMLIRQLESLGNWTFAVSGANIDLTALTEKLGIQVGNVSTWDNSTYVSTRDAFTVASTGATSYMTMRGSGGTSTSSFYEADTEPS